MASFKERQLNFAFDQTTEDETVINDKRMEDAIDPVDVLFYPEQPNDVYVESRFVKEEQLPESLKQRRKGYNRNHNKKYNGRKPRRNDNLLQHERLQPHVERHNQTNNPNYNNNNNNRRNNYYRDRNDDYTRRYDQRNYNNTEIKEEYQPKQSSRRPDDVFNVPHDPRSLSSKDDTSTEVNEMKPRFILTNKHDNGIHFNSETTFDSSVNTQDTDLFEDDDEDADFFSTEIDLFQRPKKFKQSKDVQLY